MVVIDHQLYTIHDAILEALQEGFPKSFVLAERFRNAKACHSRAGVMPKGTKTTASHT